MQNSFFARVGLRYGPLMGDHIRGNTEGES